MTNEELAEMFLNTCDLDGANPYKSIWINGKENDVHDSYEDLLSWLGEEENQKGNSDATRAYDACMKRWWRFWSHKGGKEEMFETAPGELKIIIDSLADYHDIASVHVAELEGYQGVVWKYQLKRIEDIQKKLEQFIGYDRDKQLEICRKKRPAKEDDIGEDAMILAVRPKGCSKKERAGGTAR